MNMPNQIRSFAILAICALYLSGCASSRFGVLSDSSVHLAETVDWPTLADALRQEEQYNQAQRLQEQAKIQLVSSVLTATPTPVGAQTPARLAFIQGGDLWVKELPDGKPLRLTDDGINQSPLWSPSGEWLAFIKNSKLPELWVAQSDGSGLQQIVPGVSTATFAWSPVDDKLAVAKGVAITLYSFKTGAKVTSETAANVGASDSASAGDSTANISKIAWSPQGDQIAFTYLVPTNISTSSQSPDQQSPDQKDGLWLLNLASGKLTTVLESGIPEKGEIVLQGWSSDGATLYFWQAPVLSASMMADGIPFYQVAASGGAPQLVAEQVLVLEDAVQSRPNDQPELAIVEGSGREMWNNKQLHAVVTATGEDTILTMAGQAVAYPTWSPSGDAIAYIAMPAVDGVGGGSEAKAALDQRQLWIVDSSSGKAHSVTMETTARTEAPQWINNDFLLVVRMDDDGNASLWQIERTSGVATAVVNELSPTPDWFGYYGHLDWRPSFALWRPALPAAPVHQLSDFIDGLQPSLTQGDAIALWGQPAVVTGSGLLIYQYPLEDGLTLWLAFPGDGPVSYAHLYTSDGRVIDLRLLPEDESNNVVPATVTPSA